MQLHWHSAGTSEPRDEKTDFMAGYGAVIGPVARKHGFAWQVIGPAGEEVAGGDAADGDAAKAAVLAWWEQSVDYSTGRRADPPAGLLTAHRCHYCGKNGPAELFEAFNTAGNLACAATYACELRQAGEHPAYVLGRLLRAVRAELATLTTDELVSLAMDITGLPRELTDILSRTPDGLARLTAEQDDRDARKARQPMTARSPEVLGGLELSSLPRGGGWHVIHADSGENVHYGYLRQRRFAEQARADFLALGIDWTPCAADMRGVLAENGNRARIAPVYALWSRRARHDGIDLVTGEHYSWMTHYGQVIPSAAHARELASALACYLWS